MTMRAIISGGGIGGLATAAALGRRGWDVTVFEAQRELRAVGAGIYISSNGLTVLEEIGAYERAIRNPFMGLGVEQRDHNGEIIAPAYLGPGQRLVSVPRSDLLAGLEEAARAAGVKIETGKQVIDADANGSFRLASGDRIEADLAIGCDGVMSPVRSGLGLELFHERTAEGALRFIVDATQEDFPVEARNRCIENWNGTRRFLVTPINEKQVYLALCCRADDVEARDTRLLQVWRDSFPDWAFLLDRVSSDVSWNVYSVIKCKSWSAGNACIVGDAAHAQPPNLGQGGGMAMQNGLALAAHVANVRDRRDIPSALAAWETAMRPLVNSCQHWAILFGELANVPNEYRTDIIRNVFSHPWVQEMVKLAATSKPITSVAAPASERVPETA